MSKNFLQVRCWLIKYPEQGPSGRKEFCRLLCGFRFQWADTLPSFLPPLFCRPAKRTQGRQDVIVVIEDRFWKECFSNDYVGTRQFYALV